MMSEGKGKYNGETYMHSLLLYMTLPWDILIPEKVAREMRVKNPELEDEELM